MLALIREQELCIVPYPPALFYDTAVMEKFAIRKSIRYQIEFASSRSRLLKKLNLLLFYIILIWIISYLFIGYLLAISLRLFILPTVIPTHIYDQTYRHDW